MGFELRKCTYGVLDARTLPTVPMRISTTYSLLQGVIIMITVYKPSHIKLNIYGYFVAMDIIICNLLCIIKQAFDIL